MRWTAWRTPPSSSETPPATAARRLPATAAAALITTAHLGEHPVTTADQAERGRLVTRRVTGRSGVLAAQGTYWWAFSAMLLRNPGTGHEQTVSGCGLVLIDQVASVVDAGQIAVAVQAASRRVPPAWQALMCGYERG